jgi:hypothetical protein
MHRFTALQFGRFSLANPVLLTAPVPGLAFDAILGLDILRQQRLLLFYASLSLGFGPG